jgi:catecholate siderophore receptor
MPRVSHVAVLAASLLVFPALSSASAPPPRQAAVQLTALRGRVLDAAGQPIAGALVTVQPPAGAQGAIVTDEAGVFALTVVAGVSTVTVSAKGFAPQSVRVTPPLASTAPLEFTLQVEGVREIVNVAARAGYQAGAIGSATRTATPLRDVPQAVSVVTSALISDQRMQSMADVVRYMPGVSMAQGEGNRDTPILRGNNSTSDFFVDGVRDDVQYFRDVYNVDRVEALKGPNAMIFGRGGVGGVINRVTRQADWTATREVAVQAGSWDNRRITADVGQGLGRHVAGRVTGVYEDSGSYRAGVGIERYGLNPTVAVSFGPRTTLRGGYEYFHDERVADRGIPSFQGRPIETRASQFFGDPTSSPVRATVNLASAAVEHRVSGATMLRSRVGYGVYDKFYQNVFPGAVNAAGTSVSISAYNNATDRTNLFSQTDLVVSRWTGRIEHTILTGVELGRQVTDNLRHTGYFTSLGAGVTSFNAPVDAPSISVPIEFRQSATDADNHGLATVAAVYAQDQVVLSPRLQAVGGVRIDRFEVDFRNNRTGATLASTDTLVSPRLGVIYKPAAPVSIYGSYSRSYLPRAGEQLGSLSPSNEALDPETFRNYELGVKWDFENGLSATGAVYRLVRGNVATVDPADPTRSILLDAQQATGVELGAGGHVTDAWTLTGGYAYQDAVITRTISPSAVAGAALAQVPRHSFSLWNRYDVSARLGVGVGVVYRGDVFTSTDNLVTLPSFTRADVGVFYTLHRTLRAQINIDNLFDARYYASAHSNTNITPGSPRAVRVTLTTRF